MNNISIVNIEEEKEMPIKNRCCDFKLLEEKCFEFNHKNRTN